MASKAVRVPVPQPAADQVLIRVAASSLNPLEYKLADLHDVEAVLGRPATSARDFGARHAASFSP